MKPNHTSHGSAAVHVGTSGWSYGHWMDRFYPDDLPDNRLLAYYSERFSTVEVNNTFYNMPKPETLRGWYRDTPSGFLFAVKASRYITHMKKLKDPEESLKRLLGTCEALEDKLGPVLFQLPPHWRFNADRLEAFLSLLPNGHRYTFEMRDPSWFDDRCYDLLTNADAAFCMYELAGTTSPKIVTADFVYIRLHGPTEEAYAGSYDTETLAGWAGACSQWVRGGTDVFCYFDNDQFAYAPANAGELGRMLGASHASSG